MKPENRIIRKSIIGMFLLLLIFGYGTNFLVTAAMIENRSFQPMQETATWEIINHSFSHKDAIPGGICFINATYGWVVGQNQTGLGGGIIINTKDGGDSWQLQLYNSSQMFRSLDIIDNQTIWVTGLGSLVYSHDGGQTWNESIVVSTRAGLGAVKFINKTHGWTSTMNDIYKTTDGGKTWQNVTSWIFDDSLRMIHFVSSTEAWAIGFSGIYHTENTCEMWVKSYNRGGWSLSFVSDNEAWAVGDDWIAKMTDGKTWVEQSVPRTSFFPRTPSPYFTDILFIDSMHGWIAGDETEISYTPNGGRDWYSQDFPGDTRVIAIDFINLTHGWAVGWGGYIYRTTHGNILATKLWIDMSSTVTLAIIILSILFSIVICHRFLTHRKKEVSIESTDETSIEVS